MVDFTLPPPSYETAMQDSNQSQSFTSVPLSVNVTITTPTVPISRSNTPSPKHARYQYKDGVTVSKQSSHVSTISRPSISPNTSGKCSRQQCNTLAACYIIAIICVTAVVLKVGLFIETN